MFAWSPLQTGLHQFAGGWWGAGAGEARRLRKWKGQRSATAVLIWQISFSFAD